MNYEENSKVLANEILQYWLKEFKRNPVRTEKDVAFDCLLVYSAAQLNEHRDMYLKELLYKTTRGKVTEKLADVVPRLVMQEFIRGASIIRKKLAMIDTTEGEF